MSTADDECFDGIQDLGRLDTHQLLERLVRGQERMEKAMSAASDYMKAALDSLDVQMKDLQTRLTADAQALKDAITGAQLGAEDEAALTAAADRVQATAVLVSQLDMPTPADPTPVDPTPTPADPTPVDPTPAPVDPAPVDPPSDNNI